MNKRNLFSELSTVLNEAKLHSEGKLTLKSHTREIPEDLNISPHEILKLRQNFNMTRVFSILSYNIHRNLNH